MREQLNSNPMVQMGVIAVLLVAAAIFLLTTMGGGGEEEEGGSEAAEVAAINGETPVEPAEGALESPEATAAPTSVPVPPVAPPRQVVDAFKSGATVALIFVRDGGIDDRLVRSAASGLASVPDVISFVVPAREIARYSAVTSGVGVERVPALVVLTPKRLDQGIPTASVHYGYQTPESVIQAVIDAGYKGPTLAYHP
jgi:hypothetical protein